MKLFWIALPLSLSPFAFGCSGEGTDQDGGGGNGSTSTGGAAGVGTGGGASLGTGGAGAGGDSGLGTGGAGTGGDSGFASGGDAALGTGGAGTGGDVGLGTGGDAGLGTGGDAGTGGTPNVDCTDTNAAENFSFFVTSWHHMQLLSGSDDGFGGDLRYGGATDGLTGADNICQEIANRVCHGHKTWKAYLSTSTVNAKDRIAGTGPWYDYAGNLVADDVEGLLGEDARPAGGCCDDGIFDETGVFHDGETDVNNDGIKDDDHDTMTATASDGTYDGFSCDDWTSTTATPEGGLDGGFESLNRGLRMGHTWPAGSGQGWQTVHAGHACAAGTNFIQNGGGDPDTVGGGGGYGAIYCFAVVK